MEETPDRPRSAILLRLDAQSVCMQLTDDQEAREGEEEENAA